MRILTHSATLVAHTPDPEKLIEQAGRLCYKSEDRITEDSHVAFIRMLLDPKKAHESVLEHATASFIIGTDRGISHEIVRHRLASYSQTSTRYVNYSKDKFGNEIAVVKPVDLVEKTPAYYAWREGCKLAEGAYMLMLDHGAKPQVARSVLPTCTYTEIAMTANFREWRHFLKMRLSPGAHPDIRVVAGLIRDELLKIAPTVFAEFHPEIEEARLASLERDAHGVHS
jgi:thymidylate synthase (FAD)